MKKIISYLLLLVFALNFSFNFVYADVHNNPFTMIPATAYSGKSSSSLFKIPTGKQSFQNATNGVYVYFSGYDFDAIPSKLEAVFGTNASNESKDFIIEVRADSIDGTLIAKFDDTTPSGDTSSEGVTFETEILNEVQGVHDIYFVWRTAKVDFFGFKFHTITTFELTEVSVEEGNIDINTPKVSFKFNSNIKESSVSGNVSISSGTIYTIVGGKTLDVYFSKLENKQTYTITLGSGLCSTAGYYYAGDTFVYTVTSQDKLDYSENFTGEDFVIGEAPPSSDDYKFMYNYAQNSTGNGNALVEEVNGVKCISISSNTKNVPVAMSIPVKNIGVGEYIELSYKVKRHSVGFASHTLGHIRKSGKELIGADLSGTTITNHYNGSFTSYQSGALSYNTTDENGFSDVFMKIKRNPVNNYIYVEVYNPHDLSVTPFTINGEGIGCTEITSIELIGVYPTNDDGCGNKTYITDINYTVKKSFDSSYCFTENVNIDKNGIDILFNGDVNSTTINGVKLLCGDEEVSAEISMKGTAAINIDPSEFMKNGEEYSVVLDGIVSTVGEELIKTITFTADTGNEIVSIDSNQMRDSSNNITTDKTLADSIKFTPDIELPIGAVMLIAAYDSNGSALKAVSSNIITGLSGLDWSKIKVSVWQKTDDYYEKIIDEPYELSK